VHPIAGPAPFPSREDLTEAWGDTVLTSLSQRARARFRVGRFVSADDTTAVFGLPNALYLGRCADCRLEVEQALSAHYGRPIRIRLEVDGAAPAVATATPAEGPPDDEEPVDWDDLGDAGSAVTSPIDHVIQMFEGAEIVEE